MPTKRLNRTLWKLKRKKVWLRDAKCCQSPLQPPLCTGKPYIPLHKCHIDHIRATGNNADDNLRVLCPVCHALRTDRRHQGLTEKLLQEGRLPKNWRELTWDG